MAPSLGHLHSTTFALPETRSQSILNLLHVCLCSPRLRSVRNIYRSPFPVTEQKRRGSWRIRRVFSRTGNRPRIVMEGAWTRPLMGTGTQNLMYYTVFKPLSLSEFLCVDGTSDPRSRVTTDPFVDETASCDHSGSLRVEVYGTGSRKFTVFQNTYNYDGDYNLCCGETCVPPGVSIFTSHSLLSLGD